jgi:GNAT superfamily N-acetyltransferase
MIRLMRPSDLTFADHLRAIVGWNQTIHDWERLLRYEPQGCFIIERNGTPAGTATTTSYGTKLAWIGMILVHPDHRGHGCATALMQHCLEYLERKGVTCIKLDATPQGQPLYERLGFRAEWTLQRWETKSLQPFTAPSSAHQPWQESVACELDARAIGAERHELLVALRNDSIGAAAKGGPHSAFGLIRRGSRASYLGPIMATASAFAEPIVRELLPSVVGQQVYWDIPDHQSQAIEWARALGFTPQRTLLRMFRGPRNLEGEPKLIYGIAGPSTG